MPDRLRAAFDAALFASAVLACLPFPWFHRRFLVVEQVFFHSRFVRERKLAERRGFFRARQQMADLLAADVRSTLGW